MAKSYDFTQTDSDWASEFRTNYQRRQDAEGKVRSALQGLVDAGEEVNISEAQFEKAVQDVLAGRDFDITSRPAAPPQAAAPVLPSKVDPGRTTLDNVPRALGAGLGDIGADVMFRDIDAEAAEKVRKQREEQTIRDSILPEPIARLVHTDVISPQVAKLGKAVGGTDTYRSIFGSLSKYVDDARRSLEDEANAMIERNPAQGYTERAITDVAGSPQSLASIPGGVFAGIPALTSYNDAYRAAREQGLSPEEAGQYASEQAAIEGGISAVPTGGLYAKIAGKTAGRLAKPIAGRVTRTLTTAAGEGVEEGLTTVAQDAANRIRAEYGESEEGRAFAAGRVSTDLLDDTLRSAAAGVGGGAGFGGFHASLEFAAEKGKQASDTVDAALREGKAAVDKTKSNEIEIDQNITNELVKELQKDAAFRQREAETAYQDQLKADEMEAGFRSLEAQANQTTDRVERYGDGVVERVPVQPTEVTPEFVAQEREDTQRLGREQAERVTLGKDITDLEKAQKRQEKAAKAKEKADAKKLTQRRAKVADEVLKEFPNATQEERVKIFRERMAQPVKETPKAEKPKRAQPKAVPANVSKPSPSVPDSKVSDKGIADLAAQLNLGMRETLSLKKTPKQEGKIVPTTKPAVEFNEKKYEADTKTLVKKLVDANKQETADVQNLIRQGKLKIVPNQEVVGREVNDNVAEYDTNTGEMYLYTDKVKPADVVGVMARALHESTHAGQFNDREGRPSLLKQMMSPNKENKASKAILKAANGGNQMAKRALEQAQRASPNEDIQNLELVPYFVTEAAKARGKEGQLRGVANDIIASAKTFMRDKLGANLEISMNDLARASQQTAGEIVKTDVKPAKKSDKGSLGMVLGPTAKGFKKAQDEGRTYTEYADQGERFEISDSDAELVSDSELEEYIPFGPDEIQDTELEYVLSHDKLFREYPWLANYRVAFSQMDWNVNGNHDPSTKTIGINSNLLRAAIYGKEDSTRENAKNRIRDTLLHEAQHAIQAKEGFVSGANAAEFVPQTVYNARQRAAEKLNEVVKRFDLGRALQTLPPEIKRAWENEVKAAGVTEDRDIQAGLFLEEGYYDDVSDRMLKRYGEQTYQKAVADLTAANRDVREAENKAFRTYLRDQGEFEARGTERRSRMTQAELDARPRSKIVEDEEGIRRDETLDTRPNARRRVPAASQSLGMAETLEDDVGRRYVPAWVTGLFDTAQGTGRKVNELVEYARTSPAATRMIAEAELAKYDSALSDLAKTTGQSPAELNAEIAEKLDAVDKKSDSYDENRKAFVEVASQYGDAGQALINLRDQIDDLTFDILKQRAATGKPLTEDEKKLYGTLLANLGRYSHRQYAVNAGDIGNKYAKKVWDNYNKQKKGKGNGKTAAGYAKVANAVSYLVDNNLTIPDTTELAALGADQTRSLYETWVGPTSNVSQDEMKIALDNVRNKVTPERMERQAEQIVKEMLGLVDANSPTAKYYRGGKQDNTILQERTNIPKELRDLMGEITEPATKLMLTAGKQAEFVARNKMLLDLTNERSKDIQPPDAAGSKAVSDNKMTKLEGEMWGPMEGYYVSPNMRNLVGDTLQQLATFEQAVAMAGHNPNVLSQLAMGKAMVTWGKIAGTAKGLQIVWNPVNFIYNFAGAPRMLLSNGNLNPKNAAKALKSSTEIIANAMNPKSASEEAIRLNKYGVTDSAFIGELKQAEYQHLRNLVKEMSGKKPSEAFAWLKQKGVGVKELYAMMDVWSKVANFYHQVDVLSDFYEKNGETRTQEEIDREAADIVNRTNITYKRAAPLVKAIERTGFTMFGPYFYEVFRSEIANTLQGIDEFQRSKQATTPEAKRVMQLQAAKRLGGQATSWVLTAKAAQLLAQAGLEMFGDDDDEKEARKLLPDYLRNQDMVVIGKDEKGDNVLFNISRLDPIGPATDIMRTIMNDGSVDDVRKQVFDLYIAPRIGTQVVNALSTMADRGKRPFREPTAQQLFPSQYSQLLRVANTAGLEDRQTKAWTNVMESFLPGVVNSYRDTNVRPVPQGLLTTDTVGAVLTYAGGNMYKVDASKAVKSPAMDYSDILKNARKDVKEIFNDHPDGIPEGELLQRLGNLREEEKAAWNRLKEVYDGAIASGMSKRKANAMLKNQRLGADVIRSLSKNDFKSEVISMDSLEQFMSNELKQAGSRKEKREVREKWKSVMSTLRAAKKTLDEVSEEQ